MDIDWCAFCGKRVQDDRLYCSDVCAAADAARADAPTFSMHDSSLALNDFAEANERHLDGTKPNEPIPKLSELKKKKALKEQGLGPGALEGAPDRRALEESKEFLRAYQRRRTWATATTAAAPDMASTAPNPGLGAAAPTQGGSASSLLTAALASPRNTERPPDPPFMSMSTPVKSTELDPSVFKKRVVTPYNYGVDERRYQRDAAYAEELMKQSWYKDDAS